MGTISNGSAHVPAFLAKLWKIVDDPSTNDLICWSEHGNSFIIHNQSDFARDLLPLYYKHNNMASFVRQLNMYGFHKVVSVEHGGLRVEKDEMEFAHPFFLQGHEDSLELIKRKVSSAKFDDSRLRPDTYNKVLMDVHQMKGRQESMDSKLLQIRRENEALWSELAALRQKHAKQQQIVSKLIQFLVSMMSSQSHRIGFKRRLPLMLNDADESIKETKVARTGKKLKTSGAVIQDITELAEPDDDQVVVVDDPNFNISNTTDPNLFVTEILDGQVEQGQPGQVPIVATPISAPATPGTPDPAPKPVTTTEETNVNFNGGNMNMNQNQFQMPVQTVATSSAADPKLFLAEELDGHLGQTQNVLDNLRDLLMGAQYNFDPSALTGVSSPSNLLTLFAPDTDLTTMKDGEKNDQNKDLVTPDMESAPTGNELTAYNPCLFELAEDDTHFFEDPTSNMFLDVELENMMTTDKSKLAGSM